MRQVAGKYLVGGITLISEIALPELPLIQQQDATLHPVTIRLGEVPCQLPDAVEVDPDCFVTTTQYLLSVAGIARYLVTEGREIVVDPEVNAVLLAGRPHRRAHIFYVF